MLVSEIFLFQRLHEEHAVPFFLKSNCLPLPSLFFRDCSYLLYDINRQTAPVSILNQFVKTSQIHNYRTRSVSSESFYVKFSRTDKMYTFFSRIGAQIWNSIPYSIKVLKRSSFRKKIKELLVNFLRSEDEYVEVSCLIKVTMHLQGCLACKRCSASSLNCRYLNPYIKLKLIGLAIRLYQKF